VITVLAAAGCTMANTALLLTGLIDPSEFWDHYAQSFKLSVLITLAFGLSAFFYEVIVGRLHQATADIPASLNNVAIPPISSRHDREPGVDSGNRFLVWPRSTSLFEG